MAHIKLDILQRFSYGKSEFGYTYQVIRDGQTDTHAVVRFAVDPSSSSKAIFNLIEIENDNDAQKNTSLQIMMIKEEEGSTNEASVPTILCKFNII